MNTIKQLSVFLENKIGSLYDVMRILSKAQIRIIAATVADTSEYGILRLITTDSAKALEALKEGNKTANTNKVIAIASDSSAEAFYNKLEQLSSKEVVIEYMYCFTVADRSFMIMRANDDDKALEVIESCGIKTLSNDELKKL